MRASLVRRPIEPAALLAEVASTSCGATTLFLGTVRETHDGRLVTGIEYAAYDAMAMRQMERIVVEASALYGTERIALEHRVGELALGEASMGIVVSHARRAAALDATRYVIEEVKRRVPIWKLEHYADGSREWVDPTRSHGAATTDTRETVDATRGAMP